MGRNLTGAVVSCLILLACSAPSGADGAFDRCGRAYAREDRPEVVYICRHVSPTRLQYCCEDAEEHVYGCLSDYNKTLAACKVYWDQIVQRNSIRD